MFLVAAFCCGSSSIGVWLTQVCCVQVLQQLDMGASLALVSDAGKRSVATRISVYLLWMQHSDVDMEATKEVVPTNLPVCAGMPTISDPGSHIIRAAIDAGHRVIPLPGPSAAVSALVASGLPADDFRFVGFLPPKTGARRKKLQELAGESL